MNKFSIRCKYKNIQMKSILEARTALFFDLLNIKWIYEYNKYLLSDGSIVVPDFFLPELKTFVECKGDFNGANKGIWRKFTIETNSEMMLFNGQQILWISMKEWDSELLEDNEVFMGKCSNCGSWFFCSKLGYYKCRKCGYWDGDHDIKTFFSCDDCIINFNNIKSIKNFLKNIGVKNDNL